MKINRSKDEHSLPDWIVGKNKVVIAEDIDNNEAERINSLPENLDENSIVKEREQIETCASGSKSYHYSSTWDSKTKAELKEYASVCGLPMSEFKSVDVNSVKLSFNNSKMTKTASVESVEVEEPKLVLDPFKLDEKADMSHMKKDDWEIVTNSKTLKEKPNALSNAVVTVRGGENYLENSSVKTAKGRNSIDNPNAIEDLYNDKSEDNGEMLKRLAAEKDAKRSLEHKAWQDEHIKSMGKTSIVPQNTIHMTESVNTQSGIRDDKSGLYSKIDPNDVPEKTNGELIAEANLDRAKSIKRESKSKHEFSLEKAPTRSISDTFSEELKKFIK